MHIDPVLQKAETTALPFCWSTLQIGDEHATMMQDAREYGVAQTGFSVAHVDRIGRRSVLSFNAHTARGGDTWEPYVTQQSDALVQLAATMHQKALAEVLGPKDQLPQLSPREVECLKWTAQGKSHTDIAIILNLSEHTVRSYLKEARVKLDSVSLAQAVSKAASMGLI